MQVCITRAAHTAMTDAARASHPHEACGLLLGQGRTISRVEPAANIAANPDRQFDIDPAALIAAHCAARAGGPALLGYFHSHPHGPTTPSATDRAMAEGDRRIWAIVSDDTIALWCDTGSGLQPLSYVVLAG